MPGDPTESARTLAGKSGGEILEGDSIAMLIDAKTAARRLCLGDRTLWALTRRDAIPCVRVGRRVLYRPKELTAWLDHGAPTDPGAAARVRDSMRKGAGQ